MEKEEGRHHSKETKNKYHQISVIDINTKFKNICWQLDSSIKSIQYNKLRENHIETDTNGVFK